MVTRSNRVNGAEHVYVQPVVDEPHGRLACFVPHLIEQRDHARHQRRRKAVYVHGEARLPPTSNPRTQTHLVPPPGKGLIQFWLA